MAGKCDCKLCEYQPESNQVIDAIDAIFGIETLMVAGDSAISDFGPVDDDLLALQAYLKVPVAKSDYVWQVAKRIRDERP
jgi:hypothetical protein